MKGGYKIGDRDRGGIIRVGSLGNVLYVVQSPAPRHVGMQTVLKILR
jgi:hypothetical protein